MSPASSAHPLAHYGTPVPTLQTPSVLLRFPGASGVREFLRGTLKHVSQAEDPVAFFTTETFDEIREGVGLFGCFVMFDPLRLHLVRPHGYPGHVYLGFNPTIEVEIDMTWVAPRVMAQVGDWSSFDTPEKVRELVGPGRLEDRARMVDVIAPYFDEVTAIVESGQPLPTVPWYRVPVGERLSRLAQADRRPSWTRPGKTPSRRRTQANGRREPAAPRVFAR